MFDLGIVDFRFVVRTCDFKFVVLRTRDFKFVLRIGLFKFVALGIEDFNFGLGTGD